MILKWGGLETSDQRLIAQNRKTKRIYIFFEEFFFYNFFFDFGFIEIVELIFIFIYFDISFSLGPALRPD